jgi:hypothetical protein
MRLISTNTPHFAAFIARFSSPVWDTRIRTAAVSAAGTGSMRYVMNPSFAMGLSPEQIAGLAMHEFLHVQLGHINMDFDDHDRANVAMDIVINDILIADGTYPLPSYGLTGPNALGYDTSQMSVHEIYALVPAHIVERHRHVCHAMWRVRPNGDWPSGMSDEEIAAMLDEQERVRREVGHGVSSDPLGATARDLQRQYGLSDGMLRALKVVDKELLTIRTSVRTAPDGVPSPDFVRTPFALIASTDVRLPDYRNRSSTRPAPPRRHRHLLVVVDTSGSMTDSQVSDALGCAALARERGYDVQLAAFTTHFELLDHGREWELAISDGGTDLDAAIGAVRAHEQRIGQQLKSVIFITDGQADPISAPVSLENRRKWVWVVSPPFDPSDDASASSSRAYVKQIRRRTLPEFAHVY